MRGNLFICLLLFFFTQICGAQNSIEIDQRLKSIYSFSQLEQFQQSNPQLLERLNFYLDNAFIITDQDKNKPTEFSGEVVIEDLSNFNILELEQDQDLKRSWNTISVYKIKNTDQLLVYHAGKNFMRDFRKHYQKIQK